MRLHFYNFLNYSSRKLKRYNTLEQYEDYYITTLNNVSFNPNNNITTVQVVNYNLNNIGNYLIYTNDSNEIISRWYIMDAERLLTGQYRLQLKRDILADEFLKIKQAPAFIEKGTVKSINDPLIYNNENMTFNEIKTSETLLNDPRTGNLKWITGYYAKKDAEGNLITLSGEYAGSIDYDFAVDDLFGTEDNRSVFYELFYNMTYSVYDDDSTDFINKIQLDNIGVYINNILVDNKSKKYKTNPIIGEAIVLDGDANTVYQYIKPRIGGEYTEENFNYQSLGFVSDFVVDRLKFLGNEFCDKIENIFTTPLTKAEFLEYKNALQSTNNSRVVLPKRFLNIIDKLKNYVIYDKKTNKYYRLRKNTAEYMLGNYMDFSPKSNSKFLVDDFIAGFDNYMYNLDMFLRSLVKNYREGEISIQADKGINIGYKEYLYNPIQVGSFVETTTTFYTNLEYQINNSTNANNSMSFGIFAIPYSEEKVYFLAQAGEDSRYMASINSSRVLNLVGNIINKYSGSNTLYDIQLLPYCYLNQFIYQELDDDGNMFYNFTKIPYNLHGRLKSKTTSDFLLPIYSLPFDQFTFDIELDDSQKIDFVNVLEKKVANETEFCRLASPNYNGQFEFTPAKNNGLIKFNVDCTYKPYNPYIHINPIFGGLYGADYNDARGLICGGEFSLPLTNNAWSTYEQQNKNYQNIFDRQIQNMETNNNINLTQSIGGRVVNAGTSAVAGGMVGGPAGAVAGGIAGLVGGAIDTGYDIARNSETMDYTKDMFGYQLGNIKALPNNITRTTAITNNNKVFPVLEFYSSTEQEKEILKNKIKYNGYTLMCIDKIKNRYVGNGDYLKCKIVDFSGFDGPDDIMNEINRELNKGVYVYDSGSSN